MGNTGQGYDVQHVQPVSACPSFSFPSTSLSSQCPCFEGQFILYILAPSQPPPYVPHPPSFSVPYNADFLLSHSACVGKYIQEGLVHVGLSRLACRALITERLVNPTATLQTVEVHQVV